MSTNVRANDIIGRVFDISPKSFSSWSETTFNIALTVGDFGVTNRVGGDIKEIEVQAVVLRKSAQYVRFAVLKNGTAVYLGDIVKTGPGVCIVVELLEGARVAVKPNSTVMFAPDGEALVLDRDKWRKITLNNGGLYAKFHKEPKPLTVQTSGGVLGIKG